MLNQYCEAIEACRDADGLIIDLRGNPGGIGAHVVCDGRAGWSVNRGLKLGTLVTRDGSLQFVLFPRPRPFKAPVAVLVDELSMSTSEILAGGLRRISACARTVFGVKTPGSAALLRSGSRFSPTEIDFSMRSPITFPPTASHSKESASYPMSKLPGRAWPCSKAETRRSRPQFAGSVLPRRIRETAESFQSQFSFFERIRSCDRKLFSSLLCLAVVFGQPKARAQDKPNLPSADTVLNQYIEATGGKAAYEKHKNRVSTGSIELPAANIKGTIKLTQSAPNSAFVFFELGPAGETRRGTDGKTAWEISTLTGERDLDGDEKDSFIRETNFYKELLWKELYDKVECVGIEDVDGKPAYKLVLTPKSAKPVIEYYDKATHLIVKQTAIDHRLAPNGRKITVKIAFSLRVSPRSMAILSPVSQLRRRY